MKNTACLDVLSGLHVPRSRAPWCRLLLPLNEATIPRRLLDKLRTQMETRLGPPGEVASRLNHRCWIISLRCPYQGHDPSHKRPTEEKVQKEYCERIPFAGGKGNDRRKKVEEKTKAEKGWEEKEEKGRIHSGGLQPNRASIAPELSDVNEDFDCWAYTIQD